MACSLMVDDVSWLLALSVQCLGVVAQPVVVRAGTALVGGNIAGRVGRRCCFGGDSQKRTTLLKEWGAVE